MITRSRATCQVRRCTYISLLSRAQVSRVSRVMPFTTPSLGNENELLPRKCVSFAPASPHLEKVLTGVIGSGPSVNGSDGCSTFCGTAITPVLCTGASPQHVDKEKFTSLSGPCFRTVRSQVTRINDTTPLRIVAAQRRTTELTMEREVPG